MNSQATTVSRFGFVTAFITALLVSGMIVSTASAAKGGAPAAHELSGAEWGAAVSSFAKTTPGAMGAHASGK